MNSNPIVIDAKGHLVGRLASIAAKSILQGQKVVVLRCEKMNISGSFYRNRLKFQNYLRKRCNVNPKRGPFHFRAPNKIFRKAVRGMVPHKTRRGQRALDLLKTYEGIPPKYATSKRFVVPSAIRAIRMRPGRKYCCLDRLSHEVGWKYRDVVDALETKRKVHDSEWFKKKQRLQKYRSLAKKQILEEDLKRAQKVKA
ncbi:hypothetical protein GJ496_010136 [Pomphorhynchus laevis]|nr:hypothetical protein GJ496_010136 [Pomphorhynchus laevis]